MTTGRRARILFSVALVTVVLGVPATAAAAADRPPAPPIARLVATSERVGGYVVDGGRRAQAVFVVPTVTCNGADATMLLAVVGFTATRDFIGGAGVVASCVSGEPVYDLASQEFDGEVRPMRLPVRVGDAVKVMYSWAPRTGDLLIKVRDLDRRRSGFDMYGSDGFGDVGTVELGVSRLGSDGQLADVPAFDRIDVRSVSVDHHSLTSQGVARTTLVDTDGEPLVRPSAATHAGHAFQLTTPNQRSDKDASPSRAT